MLGDLLLWNIYLTIMRHLKHFLDNNIFCLWWTPARRFMIQSVLQDLNHLNFSSQASTQSALRRLKLFMDTLLEYPRKDCFGYWWSHGGRHFISSTTSCDMWIMSWKLHQRLLWTFCYPRSAHAVRLLIPRVLEHLMNFMATRLESPCKVWWSRPGKPFIPSSPRVMEQLRCFMETLEGLLGAESWLPIVNFWSWRDLFRVWISRFATWYETTSSDWNRLSPDLFDAGSWTWVYLCITSDDEGCPWSG